jgi:hypothetical protein
VVGGFVGVGEDYLIWMGRGRGPGVRGLRGDGDEGLMLRRGGYVCEAYDMGEGRGGSGSGSGMRRRWADEGSWDIVMNDGEMGWDGVRGFWMRMRMTISSYDGCSNYMLRSRATTTQHVYRNMGKV